MNETAHHAASLDLPDGSAGGLVKAVGRVTPSRSAAVTISARRQWGMRPDLSQPEIFVGCRWPRARAILLSPPKAATTSSGTLPASLMATLNLQILKFLHKRNFKICKHFGAMPLVYLQNA